jgi:hypothetical protein
VSIGWCPLQAVEVEPDWFRFDWPAEAPKPSTYGDRDDVARLQKRNAMQRRISFPVHRLEHL